MCQQPANAAAGNLAQIIHSGVARNAARASGARRQAAQVYRHFGSRDGECCTRGRFLEQPTGAGQYRPGQVPSQGAERRDASERRMITVSPPAGLLPALPEPS
jgi:hypothetical protein